VKLLVIGAGAIGSLFAAALARAGHDVTVVTRPDTAGRLEREGVTVESDPPVRVRVHAVAAVPPGTRADAAVLAVKAQDAPPAAEMTGLGLAPTALLLPQNGLGVEGPVADALRRAGWPDPETWLVRAVNSVPATWVAPGVVRPGGQGELTLATSASAGAARAATDRLAELFATAGFSVRRVDDLERELWRKAILNAAINPVSALAGVPNGRLAEEPWRTQALALLREARAAAAESGVAFTDAELVGAFDRIVRSTSANRSSMLQDLDRGRPTEIDAISGAILRAGAAHGLDLPATRAIVAEVAERTARPGARPQPS
jgi:2-dehydropantoate 2-reductase